MKKKRTIVLLFVMLIAFTLAACQSKVAAIESSGASGSTRADSTQNGSEKNAGDSQKPKILIAYFSRYGNTNFDADVDAVASASIQLQNGKRTGTTEVIADMIQFEVGGDIHLIQTVKPYPVVFGALTAQNHDEQTENTLPALQGTVENMADYDVVFIGYPVWAMTIPAPIKSFLSQYDFTGKTVIPFCTHDGYGAGNSYAAVAQLCTGALFFGGIAIEAEHIAAAEEAVQKWLQTTGIAAAKSRDSAMISAQTPITITIGTQVLSGEFGNTPLAQEILGMMPLSVSMVGFGGREYYGGIDAAPASAGDGQYNFENGDITYCAQNNSLAIFYAQTSRPNLSMKVIPIGKVTSDLTVFQNLKSTVNVVFEIK